MANRRKANKAQVKTKTKEVMKNRILKFYDQLNRCIIKSVDKLMYKMDERISESYFDLVTNHLDEKEKNQD